MVTILEVAAKKIGITKSIAEKHIDAPLWRLREAGVVLQPNEEYLELEGNNALYMLFIVTDIEINMLGSEYWDATRSAMERKRNKLIRTIELISKKS